MLRWSMLHWLHAHGRTIITYCPGTIRSSRDGTTHIGVRRRTYTKCGLEIKPPPPSPRVKTNLIISALWSGYNLCCSAVMRGIVLSWCGKGGEGTTRHIVCQRERGVCTCIIRLLSWKSVFIDLLCNISSLSGSAMQCQCINDLLCNVNVLMICYAMSMY